MAVRLAVLCALFALCALPAAQAASGQRVALLMGNANYQTGPLRNPTHDVNEMAAALRALGFKVQVLLNANQNQMKRAVRDFGSQAQGAEVAFVYYSGHGTQAAGENYLIPLQASIAKEADYEVEAVSVNSLMSQIASAHPAAAIVVLDACRDNPFASFTKGSTKGLGLMSTNTGTLIAFATEPNTTAGDEGYYARVLSAELRKPGLDLVDVFRNTRTEVRRITQGKQSPTIGQVTIDRIYLAGTGAGATTGSAPAVPPTVVASVAPVPVAAAPRAARKDGRLKDCDVCPELVVVQPGRLKLAAAVNVPSAGAGSGAGSGGEGASAKEILLPERLAVGKFEVTFDEWDACRQDGGCLSSPPDEDWGRGKRPVVNVSWGDAHEYVAWLSGKTGATYRLLREAEWQFIAAAGSSAKFPWGDAVETGYANCSGCGAAGFEGKMTAPVGSFRPNALGLYDVIGNAWEWVDDCYAANMSLEVKAASASDTLAACASGTLRGGGFQTLASEATSWRRREVLTTMRSPTNGFRVARECHGDC
jgi:formylglycine-generating enzyme required for sulfatase activity